MSTDIYPNFSNRRSKLGFKRVQEVLCFKPGLDC